jgi:tRNA (adenine57-N1/adenine58-N1)-methyltransferase
LLRAVGDAGAVYSFERRSDFAEVATTNVTRFFGHLPPAWQLTVGDLVESLRGKSAAGPTPVDRVVLDMLAPWECLDALAPVLLPGGILCCYVATTTQLSRVVEAMRADGRFAEPAAFESMLRTWHVEGLAVRPDHRMIGHTGFVVTARRLADGVVAPPRRRRPTSSVSTETAATDATAVDADVVVPVPED